MLDLLDVERPAGDMSRPALPDIILYQDLRGGSRVTGDLGGGRFNVTGQKRNFCLAAPEFSTTAIMDADHHLRSLVFPISHWQNVVDQITDGRGITDLPLSYGRMFDSPTIQLLLQKLWTLCDEEGAPSRLLARAAGCEILAELCRLAGTPFTQAKGGLAQWAQRHCLAVMRERMSEDISLDELAAETQLSPYHFARSFKQSFGVPPRVYLTQLRMEKTRELLKHTDLSVTEIAQEVGYSSNQVLARVFVKHNGISASDFRRKVR